MTFVYLDADGKLGRAVCAFFLHVVYEEAGTQTFELVALAGETGDLRRKHSTLI